MFKLTTRQCTPQDLNSVRTLFGIQDILVTREQRQLTCCTPTTSNIDSTRVLPATDNVVREASAGPVRDGIIEIRTNHTGTALDHVRCSIDILTVQRSGVGEESSLGILVSVAVIDNINIPHPCRSRNCTD